MIEQGYTGVRATGRLGFSLVDPLASSPGVGEKGNRTDAREDAVGEFGHEGEHQLPGVNGQEVWCGECDAFPVGRSQREAFSSGECLWRC